MEAKTLGCGCILVRIYRDTWAPASPCSVHYGHPNC